MGFRLVHGNDADALLDRLAQRLREPVASANPLVPEIVLVPQFGLRRWLEIRLAEKLGIIANVDFAAPAEYAWQLLRAANPDLVEQSGYERSILRWRVFSLLGPLSREPGHGEIATAIGNGDMSRRLQFADALAHAYERDLAYRSERLARWERGADAGDFRAELWRRLVHAAAQPHRAQLLADWLQRYGASSRTPPGLPPRLSAFACANISPDLLRFYGGVARHIDIDFYLPNPCREYWGDVRSARQRLRDGAEFDSDAFADDENPALAAWGRAGRDLIERLFSYELVQPDEEDDCSRASTGTALLARVQRDVLDRLPPSAGVVEYDASIQFHKCHSRLREVQALHDRLLDLFAADPSLTPRDVVVMSPEIGAYAPHIDSVFGGIARDDARYLPYALSDCPLSETHPLIGVALRLFALPASRFELAEVSGWLTLPALQRRFGLDADDVMRLSAWLRDAGVRWGLDAAQRASVGAGAYAEFSWRFGLARLLLGYASGELADADAGLVAGIAPDAAVEGTNARLLGAILRIVDLLDALLRAQRREQAPREWQKLYNDALADLFDADGDRDAMRALERVRAVLADFAEKTSLAGMIDALDWRCVRDELAAALGEAERGYRFFGGGITMCGMVPLRTVPFRVICLIGMNEGAFPRRDRAAPFDRGEDRRVEPSVRDEDRYLFLQQLMAARELFYLSWVGEDARDGSREEPSAVVSELLGILGEYGVDTAACVVEHPLQPFSPRLFDGEDSALFTYDPAWQSTASGGRPKRAARFVDAEAPSADSAPIPVDWREWKRWWRNPAAAFFARAFAIELSRAPEAIDDEDDLAFSGLARYAAFHALLDDGEKTDPTTQLALLRARAELPAGSAGTEAFGELQAPLAALSAARNAWIGSVARETGTPFEFDLGGVVLGGVLPEHHGGLVVHALLKEAESNRLLQAWLDYLVLAAVREDARLVLLEWNDGKLQQRCASAVAPEQARRWLTDLAQLYVRGQRAPLPFFPQASYAYAKRRADKRKGDDDEIAWEAAALSAASGGFFSGRFHRGDDADAAFALAARDIDFFDPAAAESRDFADCALRVFAPPLSTLQKIDADGAEAKTKKSPAARGKAKAAK